MSLILAHSNEHQVIAEKSRTEEQTKRVPEVIITEIRAAGTFYPAEEWVYWRFKTESYD